MQSLGQADYEALLAFRTALRRFHHWSEEQAKAVGLTHAQHQLLLAVKGHGGTQPPTIGEIADALLLRHHSAVELINRAQAGGYVERQRDTEDARVVRLRLTDQGESVLDQLTELHLSEIRQLEPLLKHVVSGDEVLEGPLG